MASSKITKAIIPAAGLGTRFLPATKTVPKEMLTVVDAPIILYVVEEAVAAGIEDIVLIQGRGKSAIEDFFDLSYELEDKLSKDGRFKILERIQRIRSMANIISVRQKQPLGLGHAVLTAKCVVGNSPFALLLGDEIMVSKNGDASNIGQLIENFNQSQMSCLSIMAVKDSEVSKYGIAELDENIKKSSSYKILNMIEKPLPSETKSRWAITGRYALDGKIFEYLAATKAGKNGEIQLTDAMKSMLQMSSFWGLPVTGVRYDAGDKLGFIKANVELALNHSELATEVRTYLFELVSQLN